MAIPDLDLLRIRRYVEARNARIPAGSRQFVRIEAEVEADGARADVTIVERRAPWDVDLVGPEWSRKPIARLRYDGEHEWTLWWADRSSRFRLYDRVAPSVRLPELLEEVENDTLTVFWG
jgi:hypothetical protein